MGNLDFARHAGFSWYCLLLMFTGIVLLVIAVLRNQVTHRRVINAIFGVGFFGYGFYLTFLWGGGTYFVFFKAFVLPVLLIIDTLRRRRVRLQPQPYAAGGTQTMGAPSLQPVADPGVPPPADPGVPPGLRS